MAKNIPVELIHSKTVTVFASIRKAAEFLDVRDQRVKRAIEKKRPLKEHRINMIPVKTN